MRKMYVNTGGRVQREQLMREGRSEQEDTSVNTSTTYVNTNAVADPST